LHPSKTPTAKPLSQLGVFTMNVRGMFKSRYDLQQAIHQHIPDIMVLTETKLRNTKSKLWMDGLMKIYKRWSFPHPQGGTMVCVRKEITILNHTDLAYSDTSGRIVAIKINSGISPLLVIGTYWPSGSRASALDARAVMEKQVAGIINDNNNHIPLVLGDMNATLHDNDRASGKKYPADAMHRNYLADMALSPIDAKDTKTSQEDCPRQRTHQQATCSSDASGNTIYTNGRIDDILLPTDLANKIRLD